MTDNKEQEAESTRPYWLTMGWWQYILEPVDCADDGWFYRFKVYRCRWQGHPHGVVWYNTNGLEPDMTCKNCGDDLG